MIGSMVQLAAKAMPSKFRLLLASIAFSAVASGQEIDRLEAQVRYVPVVAEQVSWPRGEPAVFRVAVVSADRRLRVAFEALASRNIRGRPIELAFFFTADFDPDDFQIIYLDERYRGLNERLFQETEGALLMVEGRVSRDQQMVSFTEQSGQVLVQINRDNLVARGFEPSIGLLEFAGTRQDLSDQLRANQARLTALEDEVSDREARLDELNLALQESERQLVSAQTELTARELSLQDAESRLESLAADIDTAQREVAAYQRQLDDQQALFEAKQAEIETGERLILDLQVEIDASQRVLDQQLAEIARQRELLLTRNETIVAQRETLLVVFAALLLILVVAYFSIRLNTLRKRANTELEKLNTKLYEEATVDSLTGLFNRRHFLELAEQAFTRENRVRRGLTVLMLDVDHFKKVNDQFGHAAGDEAIRAVGAVLTTNLREYDIVGRLGGEEYAMMLVDCEITAGSEIADRVRQGVADKELVFGDKTTRVTISIGVAQASESDETVERTLSRADQALYKAKDGGRNRVCVADP